jgi:hypothetical protein
MFPWKKVTRGFLLAPLPVWGLLAVWGFFNDLTVTNWSPLEALAHEAFLFPYYVIGSYLIAFAIALPLYALGWRYFRVSLVSCLICGALIGGGPAWFFFALQYLGLWPKWDNESLGGVPLIVNHQFTIAGLTHYFMTGVSTAACGAAIGLTFWLIAVRQNTAAQSKAGAASV